MPWQIIVLTRAIPITIFATIFFKRLLIQIGADTSKIRQYLLWQYIFCASLSVVYAFVSGLRFEASFLIIFAMGLFLNSFGVYCQWQAVEINLAKTSLLTQPDDIIAMLLGYAILGELRYLTPRLILGLSFCFIAAILLVSQKPNLRLFKFIIGYSIPWGIISFLERPLALNDIPRSEFMLGWYSGSLLGIICLILIKKQNISITITKALKESAITPNANRLAAFVWLAALFSYWGARLAPITIYQPIAMISEAVFPALIGLFVFKERKTVSTRDKFAFIIGMVGISLIAFSF